MKFFFNAFKLLIRHLANTGFLTWSSRRCRRYQSDDCRQLYRAVYLVVGGKCIIFAQAFSMNVCPGVVMLRYPKIKEQQ